MSDIYLLMLGAIPAVLLVWVLVSALKVYGFVREDSWLTAPRAALSIGIFLTVVGLVGEFVEGAEEVIAQAAPLLFAGLVAGLFYDIVGDPLLAAIKSAFEGFFNRAE